MHNFQLNLDKYLLILFLSSSLTSIANEKYDWENPHVLGVNKLPYHVTLGLPSEVGNCKEVVSLNGDWKFLWSPDP